jgi:hypothetical protein
LLAWFLALPIRVEAQAPPTHQEPQGYKAVWSCPEPCTITGSTAVIDASAFCSAVPNVAYSGESSESV